MSSLKTPYQFRRVIHPVDKYPAWWYSGKRAMPVFVEVIIDSEGELTMTGVEGPRQSGNCAGSCGQIVGGLLNDNARAVIPNWSRARVRKLQEVWERWHLNHLRAGTPVQEEALREYKAELGAQNRRWDYSEACEFLRKRNLYEVQDPRVSEFKVYRYGHGWLHEELPDDVRAFLESLPATDKVPAWV